MLARITDLLTELIRVWWQRVTTSQGLRKAGYISLPFVAVCLCCGALQPLVTPPPSEQQGRGAQPPQNTRASEPEPTNESPPEPTFAPTSEPEPTNESPPEPTFAPTSEPTDIPLGTPVIDGDTEWTILEAIDAGQTIESLEPDIPPLTTDGKLIRIRFQLKNIAPHEIRWKSHFPSQLRLRDSAGNEYEYAEDSLLKDVIPEAERCGILGIIDPGETRTCQVIFDVAADAQGLRFLVGGEDLFATEEDKVWVRLGL